MSIQKIHIMHVLLIFMGLLKVQNLFVYFEVQTKLHCTKAETISL